jgi:hypothetical protein
MLLETVTNPFIIGGPSKFDLMLALFEGKEVSFAVSDRDKQDKRPRVEEGLSVRIHSLKHPGLGTSGLSQWEFEGRLLLAPGERDLVLVFGMYNQFERTGWILRKE